MIFNSNSEHTIPLGNIFVSTTGSMYIRFLTIREIFFQRSGSPRVTCWGRLPIPATWEITLKRVGLSLSKQHRIRSVALRSNSALSFLGGELSVYNKDFWRINLGTSYDYKHRFYQQLVTRLSSIRDTIVFQGRCEF